MSVSPADFELYSRSTGTPLPRTPQEQLQMAPLVYKFIQNRGYQNPKGFLGQAGDFLAKAALVGGGLALANHLIPYESGGGGGVTATEPISTDDDNALTGFSPRGLLPPGRESGQITVSPVNISPQTPVARGIVGDVGSIKADLSNAVDRSDVWDGGAAPAVVVAGNRGFGPAPAPRGEAEGLRDIKFSMKPPIERDPSFFNPTGNWGVGDTANLVNSGIEFAVKHGPTVVEQGALDIGKGIRDVQKGYDDVSAVVKGVYDAGAATRQLLDSTVASLPTSSYQQSAPLETGEESILFDHPDVVQEGTGSDEVQNNRNYVLHGNVDLEGDPIVDPRNIAEESEAEKHWEFTHPQRLYTDHREFGVGGGGVNYLSAGNRYKGDPEMVGKVPSRRAKESFISSAGIPQIEEELVGDSIEQPSSGGNFLSNFVDKAKAAWDENTEIANEIAREQEIEAAAQDVIDEIRSSDDVIANPANFEQSQYFEPKAPKQVQWVSKTGKKGNFYDEGSGTGVESIGYRPDGYLEIDWHKKNEDKRTEGGYVFDDYVGALKKDNRDALVRDTADPRFIQGKMSPAEREEYINLGHREMDADADVYDALRDKKFGYGEGQVSPGKFAQRAKTGQGALLDFIDQNRDILRG